MTKANEITKDDIGSVVTFDSFVLGLDVRNGNDVDAFRDKGELLAAPEKMVRSNEHYGVYRILINRKIGLPRSGVLLGKSTKQYGSIFWQDEGGSIFSAEGAVVVAMIMPLDGTARYRKPVTVVEWQTDEVQTKERVK